MLETVEWWLTQCLLDANVMTKAQVADKLAKMRKYALDFGRHSNIPECCIQAFVNNWDAHRLARARKIEKEIGRPLWEYIPCDKCLDTQRAVAIHKCHPGCGAENFMDEKEAAAMFKRNKETAAYRAAHPEALKP